MSLSTEAHFGMSQSSRGKGDTICVVPDFSPDPLEDDFDLNKSYPCTQRPLYKKNLLALQRRYYPGSLRGECTWCGCKESWSIDCFDDWLSFEQCIKEKWPILRFLSSFFLVDQSKFNRFDLIDKTSYLKM